MSNFELKKHSCAVSWKVIFSLVNHLFNWVEVLNRSVIILVGSENRDNIWYRSSTKKILNTMSNFELKKHSCAVSWKLIFSLVKGLFKWVEVFSRSFIILVGSENRDNVWYRSSTKKTLNTMSNFELKKHSCAVSWKVIFSLVNDLFKCVEVLSRSVIILVGSETEITFDIGHLRKKYVTRCQISSSKKTLVQFHENWFSVLSRACSNGLRSLVGVSQS